MKQSFMTPVKVDMLIKKGKFLKVVWHFIHVYAKLNNRQQTKPRLKYQTWIIL